MNTYTLARFQVGDLVEEIGSDVSGRIIALGAYDGELHVQLPDGNPVVCLAENLRLVSTYRTRSRLPLRVAS